MSRPSPQEPPLVDCRACVHVRNIVDGVSTECVTAGAGYPPLGWAKSTAGVCGSFQAAPAPATPPVSADREGPDLLAAARKVVERGHLDTCGQELGPYLCSCGLDDLASAISSEEARRARPAVEGCCPHNCQGIEIEPGVFSGCSCSTGCDANGKPWPPGLPCDCPNHTWAPVATEDAAGLRAHNTALRVALGRFMLACSGPPTDGPDLVLLGEAVALARPLAGDAAVEDPRDALLAKCATALKPFARFLDVLESRAWRPPVAEQIHEIHYPAGEAEINRTMLRTARTLLAALRSAGVEPTPEAAQETKP